MNPKEKRTLERQQLCDKRRSDILQAARLVFCVKGIESATMTDIAKEAEMGVATLYRYFNTKPELVIETGIDYCRETIREMPFHAEYEELSGLEQIKARLGWLLRTCDEKQDFVVFLQQFDFFFSQKENRHPRLSDFEREISPLFLPWFDAMEKGAQDGSIRGDIKAIDAIALIWRAFASLQQRNLTRDHILSVDEQFDRRTQLSMLRDMVICYIAVQ